MPIFERMDEAIKRRSILINFKFRFTNKPEFENDRNIDSNLHDKLNNSVIGMTMCYILYNAFEHNYDAIDHLPNNCKQLMDEFLSNNDPTHDFLNSNSVSYTHLTLPTICSV